MNLFRFMLPQVKESAVNRVIVHGLSMSEPVSHAPYGTLAREAYERNIVVYQCVSEIAKNAASVPWFLMKEGRGSSKAQRFMTKSTARKTTMFRGRRQYAVKRMLERTEVENHPLLSLLEKPNPLQAQAEYIAQQVSFLLLAGNAYEEFLGPLSGPNRGKPLEMYNLRPDRVRILPARDPKLSIVAGYEYRINDDKVTFDPEMVIHKKFFHPTNDWYGLSPLQVAIRAYTTDNLSADWNFALLKNQGRPGGALVVPGSLDDIQFERAKKQVQEEYSGQNVGLPALFEGGLKWEPMTLTPLEMDWLESRAYTRVELCSVYNVPPELVGDASHKTYNSFPEARRAFWMEAVLPILDMIRDTYNMRLAPAFGDNFYIDYDRDQIDALAEEANTVWDRVGKATHISYNEAREATGYETYEESPDADVPKGLLAFKQAAGLLGAASSTEDAPGATGAEAVLPETSLNGAQVAGLVQILQQVAVGQLPRATGVQVIAVAFNLDVAVAEVIMGEIGRGFEPSGNEPTPLPDPKEPQAPPAKMQGKSQQLSTSQKAALARIRRGMKGIFKEMGKDLANDLKRVAGSLE